MARINKVFTITAGTPQRTADGATNGALACPATIVDRIFIQPKTGGSGNVQVMDGIPAGATPGANGGTSGQLTAEIAAASVGAPGGSYEDTCDPRGGAGIDLSRMWIDGSHTGDLVTVSYNLWN